MVFPVAVLAIANNHDRDYMERLYIEHHRTRFWQAYKVTHSLQDLVNIVNDACIAFHSRAGERPLSRLPLTMPPELCYLAANFDEAAKLPAPVEYRIGFMPCIYRSIRSPSCSRMQLSCICSKSARALGSQWMGISVLGLSRQIRPLMAFR